MKMFLKILVFDVEKIKYQKFRFRTRRRWLSSMRCHLIPSAVCLPCVFLRRIESQTKTMLPDKDGPAVGGGQTSENEDPSVSLFREYLRLRTVHPEPDYGEKPARHTELQTRTFSLGNDSEIKCLSSITVIKTGFCSWLTWSWHIWTVLAEGC